MPRLLLIALGLAACHPADETVPDDPQELPTTPELVPDVPPIDDAPLFDADHLVQVDIEMNPMDWDNLRNQTRTILGLLKGEDCMAEPFPSPFTYFEGDVTVDGEALQQVGLRKKGLIGSLSEEKPSLKIKTDKLVDDQVLANGTERLTFNNERQDPSLLHACLAYGVFADAGMPAPRCNFATLTMNGAPLGVYAHVEAVKKDMLRRHFSTGDGDLYEGTLSDFVGGWTGTFDPKTDDTDPALGPIHALVDALEAPDSEVVDAVGAVVDLDRFVTFWALEALIGHWDGYAANTNNFYVYRDPATDLLTFMPWGADAVFEDPNAPLVFTAGHLAARLWNRPQIRSAYLAEVERLLDEVWDEGRLHDEVDRMAALVLPHALEPATVEYGVAVVHAYIDSRRPALEAALADPPGDVPEPLRDDPCVTPAGPISTTFDTVWDSLEHDPFTPGYAATFAGDMLPALPHAGAVAGFDGDGVPIVATLGVTESGGELYQILAAVYDWNLEPDVPYALDFQAGVSYLFAVDLTDPQDEGELVGIIDGTLTFSEVDTTTGAATVGTIEGELLEGFF